MGTSDPQLWVKADGRVIGKTSVVFDTVSPVWPYSDQICLSTTNYAEEICAEIRDDYPPDDPKILNQACFSPDVFAPGGRDIKLSADAHLTFTAMFIESPV